MNKEIVLFSWTEDQFEEGRAGERNGSTTYSLALVSQTNFSTTVRAILFFSHSSTSLTCGLLFSSVQSFSQVQLFMTPWTAAHQASLSITNSQSLLKPMSIESVMPSNHLILCRPLLLQPSIFTNIRVFPNESVLLIRWPKYWSVSFSFSPSNEYSGLIFL